MDNRDSQSGQGRSEPRFNFPKSQIDQAMSEITGDFVLVDTQTGRVWTSLADHKYVDKALRETTNNLQPA